MSTVQSPSIQPVGLFLSSGHETDIEHLLATASRLSEVEKASQSNQIPLTKFRSRRGPPRAKFRTTSVNYHMQGTTLDLTLRNGRPRFPTSMFSCSCKVSVLLDAEPPFLFASTVRGGDVELAAKSCDLLNRKMLAKTKSSSSGGIRRRSTTTTSLLELVAMLDTTCNKIVETDGATGATGATGGGEERKNSAVDNALIESLRQEMHSNIAKQIVPSRLLLALLDLAANSKKGNTLSDPNPFSDSMVCSDDQRKRLIQQLNIFEDGLPTTTENSSASIESIEFLSWMYCSGQGSRVSLHHLQPLDDGSKGDFPKTTAALFTKIQQSLASEATKAMSIHWWFDVEHSSDSPKFERLAREHGVVTAYHGTDACNVWSCLQNGLLQMSGTDLQKNGAAFGDGVYLAEDLAVSIFYAAPWDPSARSSRMLQDDGELHGLRFVFECEVIDDVSHKAFKDRSGKVLEHNYLVVQDSKQLRIRRLMVFNDAPSGKLQQMQQQQMQMQQQMQQQQQHPDQQHGLRRRVNSAAEATTTTARVERSNGDDWRSRIICCAVAVAVWFVFYSLTNYMHASRKNKIISNVFE